jgi:chitodextrinase
VLRYDAILRWDPSTDNVGVAGYRVLLDGNVVGSTTGTSYTIEGLRPMTEYRVSVVAYDAAGNVSPGCESYTITPALLPDILPPTQPGNLTCAEDARTMTSVAVTWEASTDNVRVSHYEVRLNGELVDETNKTNYEFTDLTPSTDYEVSVTAVDTSGNPSRRACRLYDISFEWLSRSFCSIW